MRLIDADAVLRDNKDLADREIDHPKIQTTLREVIEDAATVRYAKGHWKSVRGIIANLIVCSECGADINITNGDDLEFYSHNFKYCPYCGAYMREAGEQC